MFSTQYQNQALFHLSQISNILTPRQNILLHHKKLKSVKKEQQNGKETVLYADSFNEASKNYKEYYPLLPPVNNIDSGLIRNDWNVSYISKNTFFENKHGFAEQELNVTQNNIQHNKILPKIYLENGKKPFISSEFYKELRHSLFSQQKFVFDVQVRGFKTERSVQAETVRNPTLWARLRRSLGLSAPTTQTHIDNFASNEKLKQILSEGADGTLLSGTGTPKQNLKIAFAEGYLAGSTTPNREQTSKASRYLRIVQQVLTIVIFIAIVASLMASASGSVFRIQLGNQVEVDPEEIHVTFDDVKGADEAKQELKDVVEFLKSPEKFSSLGGKLPKGVLLVGPPGTGKTLLARAVAGEAGVPFFHAAGPEFDEILVGQGARRVRDLFKAAKERSPCVVFIDEIDSVGAKRTNSVLHPYANQTINQLLSEMDGFHQNEGVIVLGATNRRDDLDQALLRPGRFDVEVSVPTPDYTGRKEILSLYLGKILCKGVDIDLLARGTTGFTGADLENMVNQAALKAAIDGCDTVSMKYLENARDKVLMGPERKSRIPDEETNLITAYHEGGHAIVAYYTKDSNPLHKVTIIPRGPSLGHTAYIPAKETYHVTKSQLLATLDTMMGGRAAEELIFGPEKITSGASSDLKQATSIASHMVKDWGMSEKVGLRTLGDNSNKPFGGGETLAASTTEQIDSEIKKIMSDSYERAKAILKAHAREHKALAEALLKYETLDAEDIKAIMNDKPTSNAKKTTQSETRIQLGNQVEVDPEEIHVTFDDVKGADEAKQELREVVEFLKNPEKFSSLGGKLPKGVLLVGPPGTGKTLLARAVAGEAGVPFFHAAGPEFDEILVGQGARRVRDLFKAAKERAPCVVFIDEIDSVGAKRTNSVLHPYANQTINQLLSEMDGFHQNEGVIVLGATNRRDDLDQALLRPGRFDVEVSVPTPDYTGRKEILELYLGKILCKSVDIDLLARGTTGFTGADLENMVNQAALKAAIDCCDTVSMKHLENARDKILMGPERKSRIPDEETNLITAYHEGGHAIVAYYTKDSNPLHKVTIIPRGLSLGHTASIPAKENYHITKSQLLATIDTMMGGRAAEELIFGPEKITSGASSDLKQATSIASHMVKDWGMSEKVGLRTLNESSKFFGEREVLSATTTEQVDSEIKKIMSESYERAKTILKAHAREHKALAEALLKYETLDAEDIKAIMNDKSATNPNRPAFET